MKIGLVLDDSLDSSDGVQQYVLTIGSWLSEKGHEVHYLVGETHRTDIENIHSLAKNMGVRFNKNRLSIPLPASKHKLKQMLHKENFDVLHVQMPYSPMLGAKIIKAAPRTSAIVGTFHIIPYSWLETLGSKILKLATRSSLNKFDQVVSVSGPASDFAHKTFNLESSVVPNAVNIVKFENAANLEKFNNSNVKIMFLGRLVERKGAMQLLKSLDVLNKKGLLKNVDVIICGKGPLENNLKKYTRDKNLSKHIEFTGYLPEEDKASYLASADIAVFPSLGGESFGIVLIEAMAAGSGVVLAGNNQGYTSVMGEGSDYIFNPKDFKSFARILEEYIKNSDARLKAKLFQSELVKQFDIRKVGPQLEAVYKSAVAKKSA